MGALKMKKARRAKTDGRRYIRGGRGVRAVALFAAVAVMGLVAAAPSGAWTDNPTQGCTPGYWKNHTDAWVTYTPTQTVDSVFTGADPSLGSATLLDALNFKGGPDLAGKEEILLRAGVAGLLNTTAGIDYGVHPFNMIKAVNAALASANPKRVIRLATKIDTRNNLTCPLS
jgi:hypothetical protein